MKRLFVLIIFALFSVLTYAQDSLKTAPPLHIITKQVGNDILLRWGYSNPNEWLNNRDAKINLYRSELQKGTPNAYSLVASDISVSSKESLESKMNGQVDDVELAAVYEAYYGEWETATDDKNQYGYAQKNEEAENNFLLLMYACDIDFEAAQMAGLGYRDQVKDPLKEYIYRFEFVDNRYAYKHKIAEKKIETPVIIDQWAENDGQVVIGWNRNKYEKRYSGYFIEKSVDNVKYIRVNDIPHVHAESEDVFDLPNIIWQEEVENNKPSYYRVIGIDAFGMESTPSESVRLMGKDRTPPSAPKIEICEFSEDQKQVDISWVKIGTKPISNFIIQKSTHADGVFVPIGQVSTASTSFMDKNVNLERTSFYKVCAVDSFNNTACSAPKYAIINDRIPPIAPINLTGSIDSSGIVNLEWESNKEIDLQGYRIQVSNGKGRVFTTITNRPILENKWRDSIPLDVLTEDIFYRISAEDIRANSSPFSEVLRLEKPDIVPPSPPVFNGYKVKEGQVTLTFNLSTSQDVVKQELLRTDSIGAFVSIAILDNKEKSYNDLNIKASQKYRYKLKTTDDGGNITYSPSEIQLQTKRSKVNKPILSFTNDGETASLNWTKTTEGDIIRLYASQDKKMKTIKLYENGETQHSLKNEKYSYYQIRVLYKDGGKGPWSNKINVNED